MRPLHDTAVIVPALDEADNLPALAAALPPGVRWVLVDNGSSDGTAEVARSLGAEVVSEPRRGYGRAVQAGLAHLAAAPPRAVAVLDADLADDPRLMHEIVGPILAGEADFVIGVRNVYNDPGSLTVPQRAGNWLASKGIARLTGHHFRDMGPFRALSWEGWQAVLPLDPTWGFNVEMQARAVWQGLRIVEVPVPYHRRRSGRSKISGDLIGTVRAGYRILATMARLSPRR